MNTNKDELKSQIEEVLRRRISTQHLSKKAALKEEASFLSGAMAALQAVFQEDPDTLTRYIPPTWVLLPLTGRSIL